MLATGLPASPGAAVGQIVFTAEEAVKKAGHGADKDPVILVREETLAGRHSRHGSRRRHSDIARPYDLPAAVVARGMGKCCVVGADDITVDEKTHEMRVKGQVVQRGRLDFARRNDRPRDQGQAEDRSADADDLRLRTSS